MWVIQNLRKQEGGAKPNIYAFKVNKLLLFTSLVYKYLFIELLNGPNPNWM